MATLSKCIAVCAVCCTENAVTTIQSVYSGGWSGLDGRPPTLPRNLVALTIHQCRTCGYCAPDLASTAGLGDPDVTALEYRRVLAGDGPFPAARMFRGYSYLAAQAANYKVACWALLNAVWVCDDRGERRGQHAAKRLREGVLTALDELNALGEQLLPYGLDPLLRLDLFRRTSQFTKVVDADLPGTGRHPRFYSRIAAFQKILAHKADAGSYFVEQAIEARANSK